MFAGDESDTEPYYDFVLMKMPSISAENFDRLGKIYLSEDEKRLLPETGIIRRKEFLFGRIAAKEAYGRFAGLKGYSDMTVFHDLWGAPHFKDACVALTLSHTRAFVGAIVSDLAKLRTGLDIEEVQDFSDGEAAFFMSAKEKKLLKGRNAVLAWSAKEALGKYLQMGCRIFDSLRIIECYGSTEIYFLFEHLEIIPVLVREAFGHFFAFACDAAHLHLFADANLQLQLFQLPAEATAHLRDGGGSRNRRGKGN